MKTILTIILVYTIGLATMQSQQPKSDFYTFSAKTAQKGKSDGKYKDTSGVTVRETTRSQGADATVFFTRGPSAQYSVQCFFIAEDEDTREQFIYDAQTQKVEGSKGNFSFRAPPLTGTVRRSISFPISGMTTTGIPVSGTLYFSSTASGSKISGWIVRLVADGKSVRMETNQPALGSLVQKNPELFDAAFK
jgi:hypothetical protein